MSRTLCRAELDPISPGQTRDVGEGKIDRVEAWLARHGQTLADFDRSTFYSDSTNDLPLLERVSHPVATNPGPALEQVALARRWPILKLFT